MLKDTFAYIALLIILVGSVRCAREVTPTGGPQDKTPPRLDSLASSKNFQTNYAGGVLKFKFNEWLQLRDPATQIFVSPPTAKKPQVQVKGKTLVVSFDQQEKLRPNTTYTINFGNAIQDLNEGNALEGFRYVFSTGNVIDSLQVSGVVIDALTGAGVKGVSVVLHSDLADSAVVNTLPDYLAYTDNDGNYTLSNVREGKYQINAFLDDNKNNKWSHPLELVAFADTILTVGPSGRTSAPPLALFKTEVARKIISKQVQNFGTATLVCTSNTQDMQIKASTDSVKLVVVYAQDTVQIWYDHQLGSEWQLLAGTDTITIKPLQRAEFLAGHRVTFAGGGQSNTKSGGRSKLNPNSPTATDPSLLNQVELSVTETMKPQMKFSWPLISTDTARWMVIAQTDSARVRDFGVVIDSRNPAQLAIRLPQQKTEFYRITLLPGAVTDFWGTPNTDTLRAAFRMVTGDEVGQLNLTINKMVPQGQYLLELKGPNGEVEPLRIINSNQSEFKITYQALLPGTYIATVYHDKNNNGYWDSGAFFTKRRPEPVYTQQLEPVRANWAVEAVVTLQSGASNKAGKKI